MGSSFHDLAGQPIIVGAGVAGLMTALKLSPAPCVLVSGGPIGATSSSILAQGGLAAAVGNDDDVALHLADTLAAGDGHCAPGAAASIIAAAPQAVRDLMKYGACFDRLTALDREAPFSGLALGLEAAHSRNRILHAGGDSSGAEIVRALVNAVRNAAHVTVLEGVTARQILTTDGAVNGVALHGPEGAAIVATRQVVLATGGVGGLYLCTTNPPGSTGSGIALAARAGAALTDMEFVQFHPTALDMGSSGRTGPAPLISEAVRGEGALLVNDRGERFLASTPGAELAPRDVVARAIWREQAAGRLTFIDARTRPGAGFARRFPAIAQLCASLSLDPSRHLLPVTPAAHYHMGGVAVDMHGRSSLPGLWACGEVACTGLHGANRLASNSLIEALACGGLVAADLKNPMQTANMASKPNAQLIVDPALPPCKPSKTCKTPDLHVIKSLMSRHAGIERNAAGLTELIHRLTPQAFNTADPAADAALVGLLIGFSALRREESRGGHARTDFPDKAGQSQRSPLYLTEVRQALESWRLPASSPQRQSPASIRANHGPTAPGDRARNLSRKIAS